VIEVAGPGYVGKAVTVCTDVKRKKMGKRQRDRAKRQAAEGGVVGGTSEPVSVRDVATREQMELLARQRAELYALENERKILKMKREIDMEKQVAEAGADKKRVDNWIAEVKSGASSASAKTGWKSPRAKSANSAWSKSWRSKGSTGVTQITGVPEDVYNEVVKRVAELEAELASVKVIAQSKAAEAISHERRADVNQRFADEVAARARELKMAEKLADFKANSGKYADKVLTPSTFDWRGSEYAKRLDAIAAEQAPEYIGGDTPYFFEDEIPSRLDRFQYHDIGKA
jgi:hypothetical protein